VIIGVTCAVVTAMVIAGVLVGVKFSLDSTNDVVKVLVIFLNRPALCREVSCLAAVFLTPRVSYFLNG